MMTKTAFFALLNDKENKIGVTAHVAVYKDGNGNTSLIISQTGAPNAWLSNHKSDATLQAAFTKYNAWLNEWFTAQAEAITPTEENVIPMNKAKAKQNQTPENLPRLQLVDVVRAAMRTMPASQEQIEAVGNLTEKELRKLIITMLAKGARVTAHLTKSKSAGYGFLTFGCNGQLPPGTYHKIVVSNMKNARDVASQYGAMMWNF